MNENEEQILRRRLIPRPQKIEFTGNGFYYLKNGSKVRIRADVCRAGAEKRFGDFWNILPRLRLDDAPGDLHSDGLRIQCSMDHLTIEAGSQQAFLWALETLRQLAEAERGVRETGAFILPEFILEDAPSMEFRGIHLCVFPETPEWEIEKILRLCAAFKLNYAVIEFWGTYRFSALPELCWSDYLVSGETVKKWLKTSREYGMTLLPQFNLLGHAALSRNRCDKHAALDFHPELQSLFEPQGWSWCLSNPAAAVILEQIVNELIDLFENPPYFHIGCDEADDFAHCALCRRKNPCDLLLGHLKHFADLLESRGCRPIIWHDMLLEGDDIRWHGRTANGSSRIQSARLCRELPRSFMIADWIYGWPADGSEPDLPDLQFFHDQGFQVLASPWTSADGIQGLGRAIRRLHLSGMLATTWNRTHANDLFAVIYNTARASWEENFKEKNSNEDRLSFTSQLRKIGWDMGIREYFRTGSIPEQIASKPFFNG